MVGDNMKNRQINNLIKEAFVAQEQAYTPYSGFRVGAALLTKDGKIYRGCNIENATYTPTNCAERTAFFKAISEGEREFEAIAIVGNAAHVEKGNGDICAPCGVCRQVMTEFCDAKTFKIILGTDAGRYEEYTLEELLPLGFSKERLEY